MLIMTAYVLSIFKSGKEGKYIECASKEELSTKYNDAKNKYNAQEVKEAKSEGPAHGLFKYATGVTKCEDHKRDVEIHSKEIEQVAICGSNHLNPF